jgi:hypothetical protein
MKPAWWQQRAPDLASVAQSDPVLRMARNAGSDSQPISGQDNHHHHLSVPVEGCARLPGLPGVRKVGPDSLTRRCSDQGCNFGARRAQVPRYRRCEPWIQPTLVARRKVRPDIATFARSRRDLSIPDIGEQPAVVVDGVAHLDLDGRSHDCPDVVEQLVARLSDLVPPDRPCTCAVAHRVAGLSAPVSNGPPASVRPLNGHDLLEPCNRRSLASATEAVAERRRRWPRWLPDPVDRGGDRREDGPVAGRTFDVRPALATTRGDQRRHQHDDG